MTLVETVVVLALIVILAAVSAPFWLQNTLNNRRIEGAADRISVDLRRVQSLAVTNNIVGRLNYNNGTYRLETSTDNGATWSAVNPWYSIATDFSGVALSGIADASSNALNEVRFDSRGSARSTAGVAQFPITLTVTRGTQPPRTVIVQRTGNVTVQ